MRLTFVDRVGSKIFHRYVSDHGLHERETVTEFPLALYMPDKNGEDLSIYKEPLKKIEFRRISEMRDFQEKYKDVAGMTIYGQDDPVQQFIAFKYPNGINAEVTDHIIACFDIEVAHEFGFPEPAEATGEVWSISIKVFNGESICLGCKEDPNVEGLRYVKCKNEQDLLHKFCIELKNISPTILTGWNIGSFDIPYLVNRMEKVCGENSSNELSIFSDKSNRCIQKTYNRMTGEDGYKILGFTVLDYLDLYKKFNTDKQDSYRLDHIGDVEGVGRKVDFSMYGNLVGCYKEGWETFVRYNDQDNRIVELLDNKKKFIKLAIAIQNIASCRLNDTIGTVKAWDDYIYHRARKKNLVIPPKKEHERVDNAGGYVKDVVPGKYEWVTVFDATSLYPSIIRALNISPETKRSTAKGKLPMVDAVFEGRFKPEDFADANTSCAINGCTYDTSVEGLIPGALAYLSDSREIYKNEMKEWKRKLEDAIARGMPETGIHRLEEEVVTTHTYQLAMKIFSNAGYGALTQPAFRYFDGDNSEAITLTGQYIIRNAEKEMNKFIQSKIGKEAEGVVFYGDTDSTDGYTIVEANNHAVSIESFYDSVDVEETIGRDKNHLYKKVTGYTTKSYDGFQIVRKPIKWIMKHKVKKRMYRISVDEKQVDITEDHSTMVIRDGMLWSMRVADMEHGDMLIVDCGSDKPIFTTDFSIEDLGIQEDWVYDLEVEETHNFFGNDILLHNSIMCDYSCFVKKIDPEGKADKHKITNAIDAFCKYDVEPFLESMFEKLCKKLNCRVNTLSMKREAICDTVLYRAKKNYVMRVYDMEGVRYTEPRLKIAGIETERSDKPGICREKMKELLTVLMDGKEEDLQKEVREFRKTYYNAPLESITFPKGVNNLEKYSLNGKSVPIHVRASHVYNMLLEQHPEILASYEKIKNGDKIRYVYLKEPNPTKSHVVGFLNKLPEEFGLTKYIDYDKMFEKAFLIPMQSMSKLIGWDCIHKPKLTSLFE